MLGQAIGIELEGGKSIAADLVISNADLPYTYSQLLQSSVRPNMPDLRLKSLKQSSSAIMFYWGVNHPLEKLKHHNLYFSADFKVNLTQIFQDLAVPTHPSFYIHVPTKSDPGLAPPNRHIMSVLVPVPNLKAPLDWPKARDNLRSRVLEALKSHFDADIADKIETEAGFMPNDFKTAYNLTDGAAFGLSHYFLQSGYFRPHNYVKGLKGLYLVGASTYPGSGIPMVLLSGKLVSERIAKDYARV